MTLVQFVKNSSITNTFSKNLKKCGSGSFYFSRRSSSNTRVLGIETSCDDTGVAIVDGTGNILGESLFSQNIIHLRYGGVNPLVARDLHRDNIDKAAEEALSNARMSIKDIDAIAVTTRPGLLISLDIGVRFAKFLAKKYQKPLIDIHHMEAHALVARMQNNIPFPFLVLLISGGHSLLAIANDVNNFLLLGESLDNAPGEVFDKVARRMKLKNIPEYSKMAGGRAIETASKKAQNPETFEFPIPLWKFRDCNFSFSGLKDSLERKLFQKEIEHNIVADEVIPEVNDLCAAFQLAVAEHITQKTERAIIFSEKRNLIPEFKNIVVSGGVACNNFIFNSIKFIGKKHGFVVIRPPPHLCTDNGVMIAWNGIEKYRKGYDLKSDILLSDIEPRAPLGRNIIQEVKVANIQVKRTKLKFLYNIPYYLVLLSIYNTSVHYKKSRLYRFYSCGCVLSIYE